MATMDLIRKNSNVE